MTIHTDPPNTPLSCVDPDPLQSVMDSTGDHGAHFNSRSGNVAEHRLEPLPPVLGKHGLTLPLSTGPAYFNYYWLRDFCPSNIDPQTRERTFDISALDSAPFARTAIISDSCLHIEWRDENHQTSLPLATLEPYTLARSRSLDPAALPRRLWTAGHYPSITRMSMAEIVDCQESRKHFARALIEEGVAMVTDMENHDTVLTTLAETLGPVTPTVDGSYFDVRLTINPTNLAYTASALELHTDLPNEEAAPGVQFLHCRANTVDGGRSLFVDGAAVAETLREEHPEDFALLSSHDIPFFRRYDNWDYRAHQRVIELDHAGNVSGVTISRHLQDTIDLPQDVLDTYYPALINFMRMLREERFINRFLLSAGECIVFDNHRIVHGRESFVARSGERHLRGCYVDRGALRSTYRTLVGKE